MLKIEFWDILFTVINLLIFYILIKIFLLKPIRNIIDKREKMVQDDFDSAAQTKKEAEELKSEYEESLQNAKAEAEQITNNAYKNAERQKAKIIDSASEEAKNIVSDARKLAQVEYDKTLSKLESDIASLALEAAEKVVKGNNSEDGKNTFDEFLNEEEVRNEIKKGSEKSQKKKYEALDGENIFGISESAIANAEKSLDSSKELNEILNNPVVSYQEKCNVIDRVFDDDVKTFIKIVCKNGKASELKGMFAEYKRYLKTHEGVLEAELFYTVMPTEEQQKGIKMFIQNKMNVSEVNLKLTHKPELAGGFVLKADDFEYDRSYVGRFKALKRKLVRR